MCLGKMALFSAEQMKVIVAVLGKKNPQKQWEEKSFFTSTYVKWNSGLQTSLTFNRTVSFPVRSV